MSQGTVLLIADATPFRSRVESALAQHNCRVLATEKAELGIQQAAVHLPELVAVSAGERAQLGQLERLWSDVPARERPFIVVIPDHKYPASEPPEVIANHAQVVARALLDLLASDRSARVRLGDIVLYDGLRLDRASYHATVDGQPLELTLTEFHILWTLAREPQRVRTRNELVEASRGASANIKPRTVDVHVKSLRRKLGAHSELVETVRGVGYRFRGSSQPS
ncbi:MAG: winged helix-turn-helix domain-containing protein [Pirellulaceae bacterium]|nr:winged helix-turn-helix domain-containing protein [Pirellulaceae bacterium]